MFKDIRLSLVLRVIAIILGVVGSILIARLGGPEVKGVSSAFAAASAIGFMIINLDSGQVALRFARKTDVRANAWNYISRIWRLYSLLIVVALAVLILLEVSIGWYILGAVFFGVTQQAGIVGVGFKGALVGSVGAALQQVSLIAAVFLFHYFFDLTEFTIKVAILFSYLIPLAVYLPPVITQDSKPSPLKARTVLELISSSLPWQLGRFGQTLLHRLDVLVVYALLGAVESGVYSVGISTAMLVTIVPAQFASQALYDISTRKKQDSRSRSLAALFSGLISALPLVLLGQLFIALAYGAQFAEAYDVTLACLPGAIAYGIVQVQSNYIRLLGTWKMFFVMNFSGAAVMLLGLYTTLSILNLGLLGAGLAFSAGTIIAAIVGNLIMKRRGVG